MSMINNESVHWLKIFFDLGSVTLLFVTFQFIKLFLKPFKSSFFCNDYTINMPFRPSTVTNFHLVLLSLVLPFLVIITTEIVQAIYAKPNRKRCIYRVKFIQNRIFEFPEQIGNLYASCGAFFFGLVATAVITDFGKVFVGRLRPNFIDVCQPDVNPYTQLCSSRNVTFLVPDVDFKCTSLDKANVEESRLSFPSGHSSLSFYSMIYVILFINYAWKCRKLGLLPRVVQMGLLVLAIFTSLSRISDNKHHPTDVLAGASLGIVISLISFVYLTDYLRSFKNTNKTKYSTLSGVYDEENPDYLVSSKNQNNFDLDQKNFNSSFNI